MREKVTETYGAPSLPGKFKSLPAEKISKLQPSPWAENSPAEPADSRAVPPFHRHRPATPPALELCYLSHTFIRDSQSVTCPRSSTPRQRQAHQPRYRSCTYTPSVKTRPARHLQRLEPSWTPRHSEFGVHPLLHRHPRPNTLPASACPSSSSPKAEKLPRPTTKPATAISSACPPERQQSRCKYLPCGLVHRRRHCAATATCRPPDDPHPQRVLRPPASSTSPPTSASRSERVIRQAHPGPPKPSAA